MTATVQGWLPLSHPHRETLDSTDFPQGIESGDLYTLEKADRTAVQPRSYERYELGVETKPLPPWKVRNDSTELEMRMPPELKNSFKRSLDVEQKNHHFYGAGSTVLHEKDPYQGFIQANRSSLRLNDELIPPPLSTDMNARRINLPFPAEHPYSSHMSRFALFPSFKSPDDPLWGDPKRSMKPIHYETPAKAFNVTVVNKAKGAPFRREVQEYPHESQKSPLAWNGEEGFYQQIKTVDGSTQPYYPTPPKMVHPNLRLREENQRLELRTANALRNIEREQWKTTYDYNYTGSGPSNALQIDDYHRKMIREITTKEDSRNDDMIPATASVFTPSQPLEGRHAPLYKQRPHTASDSHFPEEPNVPDVVINEEFEPTYPNGKIENSIIGQRAMASELELLKTKADDNNEQWKTAQPAGHPDHGLETIKKKREELLRSQKAGEYNCLPKSVEEDAKLQEETRHYLKDFQEERNRTFKTIEDSNEIRKLMCDPGQDMYALRRKVDQVATRYQPEAMYQHATQVIDDQHRLEQLRNKAYEKKSRFKTGLKFTTENISDRGTITDLHDRQLENAVDFPKSWKRYIPVVNLPQQNHRGDISSYISKTNPFSLSVDPESNLPDYRKPKPNESSLSRTGSILKPERSPPRRTRASNKNITFNEVVGVATSDDYSKLQISSSPLATNSDSPARATSAALVSPRTVKEPSVKRCTSSAGPVFRSSSKSLQSKSLHPSQNPDRWKHDSKFDANFDFRRLPSKTSLPRPQSALLGMQNRWTKSAAHKRFHADMPEQAPDLRDNRRYLELAEDCADLRFHNSMRHREKRHNFLGYNSHYFRN